MAGSDETLRLAAEVVDKWSGPLKDMQRSLRNLSDLTRKTHRQGSKDAKEQETRVSSLRREMTSLGSQVKDVVTPSMAELGITFGGVGASIAAVVASVKGFGSTATQITSLARQSKMSREEIMQWQQVGAQIGISTGQAGESLKSFSALMDQARRHSMYAFEQWKQMPGLYEALGGEELARIPDRMTQMRIAIDRISRWTADPDMRRRALRILGLPEDLAGFTKDQLDRFFSDAKKIVDDNKGKIDWEKGLDSNRAFNNLFATLEQFKLRIGSDFVQPVEHAIEKIQELFRWINQLSHPFTHVPGTFPGGAPSYGVMPPPAGASSVRDHLGGVVPRSGQSWSDWLGLSGDKSWSKLWEKLTAPAAPSAGKAPPKDTEESIKKGTKEGVLDALREYRITSDEWDALEGTGPGGGSPASRMIGRRHGFGGFRPFKTRTLGPDNPDFKFDKSGAVEGGIDRAQFADEIEKDPSLVTKMASMVQGEVGKGAPLRTKIIQLETAFNRAQYRQHSLRQALLSVTEDPRRGYYAADTYHPVTEAEVEKFKKDVLEPVLKGSDLSSEAGLGPMTGNASAGVAARQFARGTPGYSLRAAGGGVESYFREGPFRIRLPRFKKKKLEEYGPPMPSTPTFDERFKGGDKSSSLLDDARRAGMIGKVEGNASVDINLNGFPRGTRTAMSATGLFKEVRLNRGAPMVLADENG